VDLLFHTYERQTALMQSKFFFCKCKRCSDPTEEGRFLTGIKCGADKESIGQCNGWVVPTVFLNSKNNICQKWKCTLCDRYEFSEPSSVLESIQNAREILNQRAWVKDPLGFVEIVESCCKPLLGFLHSNHFLRIFYHLEMYNATNKLKKRSHISRLHLRL